MKKPGLRGRDWICIALLAGLSIAMRIPGLSGKPFWIAEVQEFAHAFRGFPGQDFMYSAGDFLGFAYHQFCHLAGLPAVPWVVRLPAFFAGSLLAPAIYGLFARHNQRVEGFVPAVFLALSLPLIAASQEARLYAGLCLFLGTGLAVELLWTQGRQKVIALAVLDALALSCHPYALFWLVARWAGRADQFRFLAGRLRHVAVYLAIVAVPALGQAVEILVARQQFRELHAYFTLQPYPPGFGFLPELLGHLGTGGGVQAAVFFLLVLAGAFALLETETRQAVTLLAWSFGAPLLAALAIWLGRGRYSFVHFLPACTGLFILAARGLWLASRLRVRWLRAAVPVAILAVIVLRMTVLDFRYHARPTRLEMGSDVKSACDYLAAAVQDGDVVATRYDKYFTALAWYCGASLPAGFPVIVPEIPDSDFIRSFLHLRARPGEKLLQQSQVHLLDRLDDLLAPTGRVFLVVPQFEDIEGEYSESLGWYDMDTLYGGMTQVTGQIPTGWNELEFPMMKIYVTGGEKGAKVSDPAGDILRILAVQERPWM